MKHILFFIIAFPLGWFLGGFVQAQVKEAKYDAYIHGCKENSKTSNTDCHLAAQKYLNAK